MKIKELIDKHGGVPAFRRMLENRKKLYGYVPTKATLYEHYRGRKPLKLCILDLYEDLGVTEF